MSPWSYAAPPETPKVGGPRPSSWRLSRKGPGPRRRDYEAKREEYLAYGLREYWIIDPHERRVTVLTRRGDSWAERVFLGEQAAEGLALPGFAVPIADLWAVAEDDEAEPVGA